ncbi:hypothetical protein AWN76_004535 [Rhodothermaceae bacterium RA]|nr:hypothetical protein AWN76_004535 [Rhodothermaceae bacterium RA]
MNVDYTLIFLAGLLGSAHCVGMCGGFALAIANAQDRAAGLHLHQLAYYTGKTLTYALLGAVVGGIGAVLGATMTAVQNGLSLFAGLVMILIGLGLMGVLRRFEGTGVLAKLPGLQRGMALFMRRHTVGGTFGLGLLNGLLPCGLVYGLLARAAATGSVTAGALTMAVFGVATIPALYVLALSGFLMQPLWRSRLNVVSGLVVILLGIITVLRGTPYLQPVMHLLGPDHGHHEQVDPGPAPDSTAMPMHRH